MTDCVRRWLPLIILVALAGVVFAADLDRYLTLEAFRAHRQSLLAFAHTHRWAAALGYMAVYASVVALSLPGGAVMTLVGGFLFGALLGGAFTVIAATLGATVIFWAARGAIGVSLKARVGGWLDRFRQGFQRNAASYLLMLRLVPLFPFFVVNIAPAFLGVSMRTYVWTTFIGIIPGTFVYASVGNGLGAVLDAGQQPDLGLIFKPEILWPLLGLAALALLPMAARRWGWLK